MPELRMLGSRPPLPGSRMWGDGVGKTAPHLIADIDYTNGWVDCDVDGVRTSVRNPAHLSDAWDVHRGLLPGTVAGVRVKGALATDDEVAEFLRKVEDPTTADHTRGAAVLHDEASLDSAFALLDRLDIMGERCTCTEDSDVRDCPNYMKGDEDTYGDD